MGSRGATRAGGIVAMILRRGLLAMVLACGCAGRAVQGDPQGIRIMPLGDSITQGDYARASYRRPLWHLLRQSGYSVDFVGSMRRNYIAGPFHRDFDHDHEGHWGWTIHEILEHIEDWIKSARPDAVLIHLGSNDLFQGKVPEQVAEELGSLIEAIRRVSPHAALFVAELIPAQGMEERFAEANRYIRSLRERSTESSPVIVVDHFSGFDPDRHTYDGVHPNAEGEKRMAERWFAALAPWLTARSLLTPSAMPPDAP